MDTEIKIDISGLGGVVNRLEEITDKQKLVYIYLLDLHIELLTSHFHIQ